MSIKSNTRADDPATKALEQEFARHRNHSWDKEVILPPGGSVDMSKREVAVATGYEAKFAPDPAPPAPFEDQVADAIVKGLNGRLR